MLREIQERVLPICRDAIHRVLLSSQRSLSRPFCRDAIHRVLLSSQRSLSRPFCRDAIHRVLPSSQRSLSRPCSNHFIIPFFLLNRISSCCGCLPTACELRAYL